MKTYLLAYDLDSTSKREALLKELQGLEAEQLFAGVWRLRLGGDSCAALKERFRSLAAGLPFYLAEVADSVECRPQPELNREEVTAV